MATHYSAALYYRLSRDDDNLGESNSIASQRLMLKKYAKDNGIYVYDEYVDDGWSGTNFNRPSFQRMIQDIEIGAVNCVITKDLSRLGRNYVQVGQYTEYYFPSKQVRYIAVNDAVDTINGESEIAPFKNILNEWYARDTSKKVKSALRARYENGMRISAIPPFGYIKSPDKKGLIVPDEDSAWIVHKIFDMASQGNGALLIAKTLTQEDIPTPAEISCRHGYTNMRRHVENSKKHYWSTTQVLSILKNCTYLGHTLHYPKRKMSYKDKKVVRVPPEKQLLIENTHEPLISQEQFDKVQTLIKSRSRVGNNGHRPVFTGFVFCADCGWKMSYGCDSKSKDPRKGHYRCSGYKKFGADYCTCHAIQYGVLYDYVLERLQYWTSTVREHELELAQMLMQNASDTKQSEVTSTKSNLDMAEKRLIELDDLLAKLYEDRLNGVLTDRNFQMLMQKYEQEQNALTSRVDELKKFMEDAPSDADNIDKWLAIVRQLTAPTELTRPLLSALVDKIIVHETTTPFIKKDREQKIEIYYRFIGKVDVFKLE